MDSLTVKYPLLLTPFLKGLLKTVRLYMLFLTQMTSSQRAIHVLLYCMCYFTCFFQLILIITNITVFALVTQIKNNLLIYLLFIH